MVIIKWLQVCSHCVLQQPCVLLMFPWARHSTPHKRQIWLRTSAEIEQNKKWFLEELRCGLSRGHPTRDIKFRLTDMILEKKNPFISTCNYFYFRIIVLTEWNKPKSPQAVIILSVQHIIWPINSLKKNIFSSLPEARFDTALHPGNYNQLQPLCYICHCWLMFKR